MKRCPGGLVFEAHRLVHHSTLGSRVIKKKKQKKARNLILGHGERLLVDRETLGVLHLELGQLGPLLLDFRLFMAIYYTIIPFIRPQMCPFMT